MIGIYSHVPARYQLLVDISGGVRVAGDRLVVSNSNDESTAYLRNNADTAWSQQAAFIDGSLLVSDTVTARVMAANSITAGNGAIANLAVDTLQLKEGSISETMTYYGGSTSSGSTSGGGTITLSVNSSSVFTIPNVTGIDSVPCYMTHAIRVEKSSNRSAEIRFTVYLQRWDSGAWVNINWENVSQSSAGSAYIETPFSFTASRNKSYRMRMSSTTIVNTGGATVTYKLGPIVQFGICTLR